jgi:predicted transcriptional regulator
MMDDLLKGLKNIGLEEKEGRVYLALLSHPGSSVPFIAAEASIPRGTCYDVLEELLERGFVTESEGEHGKRYFPQSPEHLLTLLKIEEQKLGERMRETASFVPMLTVLYNPKGPQPRVRYKEGMKGLRELQKEYEAMDGDLLQLVGLDAFLALHDPGVTNEHRSEMVEHSRHIRSIIFTSHPEKIPLLPNIETRILPNELFAVMGEMTVCGDRVAFFSYEKDMIALEIHSPAIAGTCRAALELAWKQAGEITK